MEATAQQERRLGFVGIVIEDRELAATAVNRILSEFAEGIVGRLGLPYRDRAVWVITLIVDLSSDQIGELTGRLGSLAGVTVRSALARRSGRG